MIPNYQNSDPENPVVKLFHTKEDHYEIELALQEVEIENWPLMARAAAAAEVGNFLLYTAKN